MTAIDDVKLSEAVEPYKAFFGRVCVVQLKQPWVAIDCGGITDVNGRKQGQPRPVQVQAGNGQASVAIMPIIDGVLVPSPCGRMLVMVFSTERGLLQTMLRPEDVQYVTVVNEAREPAEPSRIVVVPGRDAKNN